MEFFAPIFIIVLIIIVFLAVFFSFVPVTVISGVGACSTL